MLAALIVAVFLPLIPAAAQSVSYNAAYQNEPTIGTTTLNGVTYTTVGYQGLYNTMEAGMPSLPVEYIRFSVPWNATDFSVKATCAKVRMIPLNYPVLPSQTLDGGGFTLPDVNAYATGSTFPAQVAQLLGEDRLAGENHTVSVAVMPVTYSRGIGGDTLQVAESVNLTLSYSLMTPNGLTPKYRRDTTLRNKGFDFTRSLVVNPGDVRDNAYFPSGGTGLRMPDEQLTVDNPSTYIIVTSGNLRHSLRRLAALKRQKGIPVKIVTLAEAINDPWASGGDYYYGEMGDSTLINTHDYGKLRQYLKINYFYHGTQYALLAGDSIPYYSSYGTDLYYSDMNGHWSYGQPNYGDLNVGRLFGSASREFGNYTDKLFRYELNPGKGDRSYLGRALSAMLSEIYMGYDGTGEMSNLFPNVTQMYPGLDDIELSGCDLLDTIRTNRYGFIKTFNEGFPSGIKVNDDSYNELYHYLWAIDTLKVAPNVIDSETGNGLNLMDNKDYPAVYFSSLGQTMPYYAVAGYGTGPNFGKSFTMGKDYGGPAFLGLTHSLNVSKASVFTKSFLDILRSQTVITNAMKRAQVTHYSPYYDEESILYYNYLGDPILDLWTGVPLEYSGVTVARTNSSISVTGINSGATVSYCDNGGSVGKVTATSSSVSLADVNPNSTIMVYSHNYIPYIAPLVLQNTDLDQSQYVIAGEVLAGRQVDSSRTNGDVTVKNGSEYEIEAAGEVKLAGGFTVEKGAAFAIRPASF